VQHAAEDPPGRVHGGDQRGRSAAQHSFPSYILTLHEGKARQQHTVQPAFQKSRHRPPPDWIDNDEMICPQQLLPGPLQAGLQWLAGVIEIKGELAQGKPAHLMLRGSRPVRCCGHQRLAETISAGVRIHHQHVMLGRLW